MKKILVVPSIREEHLRRFLSAWEGYDFDETIVVEDNIAKTFDLGKFNVKHYSWKEIDYELQDKAWVIPRLTDGIRSYGFLKAVYAGADIVITLDDDCFPEDLDFVEQHVGKLSDTQVVDSWKRTFNHDTFAPRGLPYDTYGHRQNMVNVGLWRGTADIGAVEVLGTFRVNPGIRQDDVSLNAGVAGYGQYIPMCGMNLAFRKEALPIMYFPLMGVMRASGNMQSMPFRRYGDIWAGILAQRVLQHLRMGMSYGYPLVNHSKASNPYTNLDKESAGVGANEKFWRGIDRAVINGSDFKSAYLCLSDVIEEMPPLLYNYNDTTYWKLLAGAMRVWVELCS